FMLNSVLKYKQMLVEMVVSLVLKAADLVKQLLYVLTLTHYQFKMKKTFRINQLYLVSCTHADMMAILQHFSNSQKQSMRCKRIWQANMFSFTNTLKSMHQVELSR